MGMGNAFLLDNGDRIRLCDGTSFVFRSVPFPQRLRLAEPLSEVQESERAVTCLASLMLLMR